VEGSWLGKVFGISLGVGIFLLVVVFFVYVVLPVMILMILWALLKKIFSARRIG
jgi:hypothetical protein